MAVNGINTPSEEGSLRQMGIILRELKMKWNSIYKKHYSTLARITSGTWGSAVCDVFRGVSHRIDWLTHKVERKS